MGGRPSALRSSPIMSLVLIADFAGNPRWPKNVVPPNPRRELPPDTGTNPAGGK